MTGQPGTIDEVAAQVTQRGKVKGTVRRSMTMPTALRAVLLMGLMPDAGYGEVLAALFSDLALLPWHVPFAMPTDTVLATWRDAAGPEPVLRLQDMVLAASDAGHQEHDYRAIEIGDLHLGSIDGSVTRMPDTPGNRAEFGSSGTAGDSAPYPQLRDLPVARRLHPRDARYHDRPVRRGQGRSRAGPAGPGPDRVRLGVHQAPAVRRGS